MTCTDYFEIDLKCLKGMPVTPLFRHFICEAKPEKCPLVVREGARTKGAAINNSNQLIFRRRP